jgi:hypothetical protein
MSNSPFLGAPSFCDAGATSHQKFPAQSLISQGVEAASGGRNRKDTRMQNERNIQQFFTVNDFLERYRIGRTSFYREVSEGRLKLRKFGSASRVAREDAETWAQNLPVVSGKEQAQ